MSSLRVTIFYVGDGDCILVEFPDGKLGLVDSNTTSWLSQSPAWDVVKAKGGVLEFVCMTHPHADHYRGLAQFFTDAGITVREFWDTVTDVQTLIRYTNTGYAWEPYGALTRRLHDEHSKQLVELMKSVAAKKKAGAVLRRRVQEFQQLPSYGGVEIWSLAPSARASEAYLKRLREFLAKKRRLDQNLANTISAVLLLRYKGVSVILGGDAPTPAWRSIVVAAKERNRTSDLASPGVKVPHHGAKNASDPELWIDLRSQAQDYAVISAGSPHHPSAETIKHLKDAGRRIYTTGLGGPSYPASQPKAAGLHPAAGVLLGLLSQPADDGNNPCCGTVLLEVNEAGAVTVQPERPPNNCSYCG